MRNRSKKTLSVLLTLCMMASLCAGSSLLSAAEEDSYEPGTYSGSAIGFDGTVSVTITVDENSITDVETVGDDETPEVGGAALDELAQQILDAQSADIDGVSGATFTSDGIKAAAEAAIAVAQSGAQAGEDVTVTYDQPGTYSGTGEGYNGDVVLDVTFSEDGITDIKVAESSETAHVGDVAYDILFEDVMEVNGAGVDSVSGATFTSRAIKEALNDAAEQAGVSDADAFAMNSVEHEAQDPIEETYDVVVIGAGGAGMGAAAQAAQNGDTVLVIEENAEIGGNTLVSGGQFQSVMPYLVWDPDDPDATTAVWDYDGQTYDKVMSVQGCIDTLKTILDWSEEPFDEEYYQTHEFVAGDIDELSKHGVHEEYLPTLQALKEEIQEYLDWAQPKLDAGEPESAITLFSTVNLHIFQTYYGGLRPNDDMTEWNYGDYDLVSQFIEGGQDLKTWLEDQGSVFNDAAQGTLIGALWYRENIQLGSDLDEDGELEETGNWGAYFVPLENTLLVTSETADQNKIMTRTTAENLLLDDDGAVIGVTATMYDGTPVTAYANKGVVLATGGYAANISEVIDTNEYWDKSYITSDTKTTNRSSLQGDGIEMAEEAGADTVGEGWTQMMPISWIDNGNLAYGSGAYCIYVNPTTGERFVNESAERDVLSLGEFQNGITYDGTQGIFLEISNADVLIGSGYPYEDAENGIPGSEVIEDRVYFASDEDELQEVLDLFGMEADPATIYETIEAYDQSIIAGEQPSDGIAKSSVSDIIGNVEKDDEGAYLADTYTMDGVTLRIRVLAPATHHTMGGIAIDTDRHVIDSDGNIIEGLYAAGEVSGGIHAGNRLGGNAIVEVLVSGRTAANAIDEDNE